MSHRTIKPNLAAYLKRNAQLDKMKFIPGIHDWFNITKQITVIDCLTRIQCINHRSASIVTKNFKNQTFFLSCKQATNWEENSFILRRDFFLRKIPILYDIYGERKCSIKIRTRISTFSTFIHHSLRFGNLVRKVKRTYTGKEII